MSNRHFGEIRSSKVFYPRYTTTATTKTGAKKWGETQKEVLVQDQPKWKGRKLKGGTGCSPLYTNETITIGKKNVLGLKNNTEM